MQQNISIEKFCELQGCDKFNATAICKYKSKSTARPYGEWYSLISKEFNIGAKIPFAEPKPAAPVAPAAPTKKK